MSTIECISRKTKGACTHKLLRVSGDYAGFLIDSGCAVVCLQSKSLKKNIESIDETQVDVKSKIIHVLFLF